MPFHALGQSCSSDGALAYLGNTRDEALSVWLSKTVSGNFALEAAQGNTTVDTWQRDNPGLHLSTSPFVSSGSGGTHRLLNTGGNKPCLIDTKNQLGGIDLPGILFPPDRPVNPTPITPVRPPLRPVNPIPITPGLPTVRPVNPTPITPGLPIVRPIDPTPITPGLPTVRPVDPTPITPGVPPLRPGTPDPATPSARGEDKGVIALSDGTMCIDPRTPHSVNESDSELPICPEEVLAEVDAKRLQLEGGVPLTEGRELVEPSLWNIWTTGVVTSVSDRRYNLDTDTIFGGLVMGIDRRVGEDAVVGIMFTAKDINTDSFGGFMSRDVNGFSFGPYAALRLSQYWAADVSMTYGLYDSDVDIGALSGSYDTRILSGKARLYGQYQAGEYLLSPEASIAYARVESDAYDLSGVIRDRKVTIDLDDNNFNAGLFEASTEISRLFELDDGKAFMPFVEFGVQYAFERPNDGSILTGSFSRATPSPWVGSLRAGGRMLITDRLQLEASGGYLSFGQNGLDVWEGRLKLAYAF